MLLVLIAVLTAGGLALFSGPSYTAEASVFAASPGSDVARTVTFPQAATSKTLANRVIQKLNLNQSVEGLVAQIHVSFAGNDLYHVSVTASDSGLAVTLADDVAAESVAFYRELAAQVGGNSAVDQKLSKLNQRLRDGYLAALTARLKFEAAHPGAISNPNAPPRDVSGAAQLFELQLEEDAAGSAY